MLLDDKTEEYRRGYFDAMTETFETLKEYPTFLLKAADNNQAGIKFLGEFMDAVVARRDELK